MSYDLGHFLSALKHTLRVMTDSDTSATEIEVHPGEKIFADVSAHLAIRNGHNGCVVITFSESAACSLVKIVTGRAVAFDDELISDAVGEILNMMVGRAQRGSRQKFKFEVPVIAKSRSHEVKMLSCGVGKCAHTQLWGQPIGLYLVEAEQVA